MSIVGYLKPTFVENLALRYQVLQNLIQHYCRRDCSTDVDPVTWNRLGTKTNDSGLVSLFSLPGDPAAINLPAKSWRQYVMITPQFAGPFVLGFLWRDQVGNFAGAKLCAAILRGGTYAMRIGPGPLEVWGHHISGLSAGSPELAAALLVDEITYCLGQTPAIDELLKFATII